MAPSSSRFDAANWRAAGPSAPKLLTRGKPPSRSLSEATKEALRAETSVSRAARRPPPSALVAIGTATSTAVTRVRGTLYHSMSATAPASMIASWAMAVTHAR